MRQFTVFDTNHLGTHRRIDTYRLLGNGQSESKSLGSDLRGAPSRRRKYLSPFQYACPPVRPSVRLCSRQQRPNVLKCEAVKRGRKRERAQGRGREGLPRRGDKAKKCALRRQGGRTDRAKIKSDHSTLFFLPAARSTLQCAYVADKPTYQSSNSGICMALTHAWGFYQSRCQTILRFRGRSR